MHRAAIACVAALLLPGLSFAAAPDGQIKLSDEASLSFGVELRERWEIWGDGYVSASPAADRDGSFMLQRMRLHALFAWQDNLSVFFQGQDSRAWGQEANTASDEKNFDLHQGYVKIEKILGKRWSSTIGRQEIAYGEERLVGAFGWSNVGRSFDALRTRFDWDKAALEAFAAKVDEETPGAFTGASGAADGDDSDFYGLYGMFQTHPMSVDAYAFFLREGMNVKGESPGLDSTHILTLGLRAQSKYKDSRLRWSGEAAWQTGRRGPDDHGAYAGYLRGGWLFHKEKQGEIFAEAGIASGDSDPTDGDSEEFHNLYPTNHVHYGYADLMGWRNQRSFRLGVKGEPSKKIGAFSADVWFFRLDEARGRWSSAGGATLGMDASGMSGRSVGWEGDLTWKKSFRSGKIAFLLGYSYFSPGSFAERVRGEDDAVQFGYAQMTVKLP